MWAAETAWIANSPRRHGNSVGAVFNGDSSLIATDRFKIFRIGDARTGLLASPSVERKGKLRVFAFSNDGLYLAALYDEHRRKIVEAGPDSIPAALWPSVAALKSGCSIIASAKPSPLTGDESKTLYTRLNREEPDLFDVTRTQFQNSISRQKSANAASAGREGK